jgi:hypothetical protein
MYAETNDVQPTKSAFVKGPPVTQCCKIWDKVCNMRHSLHQFETLHDIRAVQAFGHFHRPRKQLEYLGGYFAIFTPAIKNFYEYKSTKTDRYSSRMEEGAVLAAFTCFADFPYDIRACIWESVAFLPRNIDLWAQGLGTITRASNQPHEFTLSRYISTQPPPAILHVNKESRAIGLKYYSLEFGLSYEVPRHYGLRAGSPPKTYINFHCDRICLVGGFDEHSFPWVFDPRPTPQIDQRIIQFPMKIAINLITPYLMFLKDEDHLIAACSPYEEVLLYYLEDDDAVHLPGPGERASIEFLPVDISTKGDRGLCFELHTRLQALRASSENSEIANSRLARLGFGEVPSTAAKRLCPNVQWVTLVINGRKIGLQDM